MITATGSGGRVVVDRDGETVLDMSAAEALQLARALDAVVSPAAAIDLL